MEQGMHLIHGMERLYRYILSSREGPKMSSLGGSDV